MSLKRKKVLGIILSICIWMVIWVVLICTHMWEDIRCVMGRVPYATLYISDFNGCAFNDCELEGESTLLVTGPDPYIFLDGKVPQGIWLRDIALELPEDEEGIITVKWYWNFGDGYDEDEDLTSNWYVDKKQNGLSEKINSPLYGMRLDLEYIDIGEESFDLGAIVINTLSPDELKKDVITHVIVSFAAQILLIAVLIAVKVLKKDEHFVSWFIRGILMEVVYFMLMPIYQSNLPVRIKIPIIIINVLLSVLIAFVGVNRDENKE